MLLRNECEVPISVSRWIPQIDHCAVFDRKRPGLVSRNMSKNRNRETSVVRKMWYKETVS